MRKRSLRWQRNSLVTLLYLLSCTCLVYLKWASLISILFLFVNYVEVWTNAQFYNNPKFNIWRAFIGPLREYFLTSLCILWGIWAVFLPFFFSSEIQVIWQNAQRLLSADKCLFRESRCFYSLGNYVVELKSPKALFPPGQPRGSSL